jgi:hypothetical protein
MLRKNLLLSMNIHLEYSTMNLEPAACSRRLVTICHTTQSQNQAQHTGKIERVLVDSALSSCISA